jgi:hypothetical protein
LCNSVLNWTSFSEDNDLMTINDLNTALRLYWVGCESTSAFAHNFGAFKKSDTSKPQPCESHAHTAWGSIIRLQILKTYNLCYICAV